MRLAGRGIDEYTLAAYLAGRLSPERRQDVAEFLRSNDDARDLLSAANQLLESEGDGHAAPRRPLLSSVEIPPRKKPFLSGSRRLGVLLWTTIILVCMTAFLTTVLVAFKAGVERGKSEVAVVQTTPGRMITVEGTFDAVRWDPVEAAADYRIVVWDDVQATVVGQVRSDVPSLDYEAIAGFLADGGTKRLWIDAFDAEERMIERSRSVLLVR